ncbi:MAG TPA: hypothetical protein VLX61_06350 [Anaerolineales bacterium]|nr:hypothetical protein [Anaerolineales bacterium]
MVKKIPFAIFSFNLLLALIASAVLTTPAFADSGTTNPPLPTSGRGSTRGSHSSSDNLSNLPSGTKVVIVDLQGDKLALGSQQAQDILNTGDPIWCPSSVGTPISGGSGCTVSQSSMSALIALLTCVGCQPTVDGTIWIDKGSLLTTTTGISLNGSTYTTWAAHKLTLKGGWNGLGTNTVDTADPSEFTTAPISITNWNNDITVSDVEIHSVTGNGLTVTTNKNVTLTRVNSHGNTAGGALLDDCGWTGSACSGTGSVSVASSEFDHNTGSFGLSVVSSGTITLTNAVALNNFADGVDLNNCKSNGTACQILSPKAVSVTGDGLFNSTAGDFDNSFNGNGGYGLDAITNGVVMLTDITAGDNTLYGTSVDNSGSSAVSTVTLKGMNVFDGNKSDGLYINSKGAITASHIFANSNSGSGNQDGAALYNENGTAGVTITGTSQFDGNGNDGLYIFTKGAITLNSITASFNKLGDGAELQNDFPAKAGVTLTGTNIFNNNYNSINFVNTGGLIVTSSGAVKLNNITASNNTGFYAGYNGEGAEITNTGASAQLVTLTGSNTFDGNASDGLQVFTSGKATASSITANSNTWFGAWFGGAVTGVTLTGTNSFDDNGFGGLEILSSGPIALSNLSVTNFSKTVALTQGNGADISGSTVSLTGTNFFDSNYNDGLNITASGAVALSNVTSTNNGLLGASGFGADVNTTGAMKITGTNVFNGNYNGGLNVTASGAISANSVTANCNGYGGGDCKTGGVLNAFGVSFSNGGIFSLPGVSLTGTNSFNNNYVTGLGIDTWGTITASSLTADGNATGDGANLFNYLFLDPNTTPKAVTITGSNTFGDNSVNGLVVVSLGAISLSNATGYVSPSGLSTGQTVVLDNAVTGAVGGVTLTGTNTFNDYQSSASNQDGLSIESYGAISLNNVTANGNGSAGASVDNSGANPLKPQAVKLTGTNTFNSDHDTGLSVNSIGAITINNLQADSSATASGADLDNHNGGAAATVTLTGFGFFQGNYGNGLLINSAGAVTTNNLTAVCNGYSDNCVTGVAAIGVSIVNTSLGTAQKVAMLGTNLFSNNDNGGLSVTSDGAITLANAIANNNAGSSGVFLDNHMASPAQAVTLTGTNVFDGNQQDGLLVVSAGAITANNLDAESNQLDGANLDTSAGTSANVTLTGFNLFANNHGNGLYINSTGAVSLAKVYSDNNTDDGLLVANATNVGVTCGYFTTNGVDGVHVTSTALTLSGVVSEYNTGANQIFWSGGTPTVSARDCPLP